MHAHRVLLPENSRQIRGAEEAMWCRQNIFAARFENLARLRKMGCYVVRMKMLDNLCRENDVIVFERFKLAKMDAVGRVPFKVFSRVSFQAALSGHFSGNAIVALL